MHYSWSDDTVHAAKLLGDFEKRMAILYPSLAKTLAACYEERNKFLPFLLLSDNTILLIFECLDITSRNQIVHVCRRLSRLVLSRSSLWSAMDLTNHSPRYIEGQLARVGKDTLLQVAVGYPQLGFNSYRGSPWKGQNTISDATLTAIIPRLSLLNASIAHSGSAYSWGTNFTFNELPRSLLRIETPHLETLTIRTPGFPTDTSIVPLPSPLFDGCTPKLRSLSISVYPVEWEDPIFKGLTSLTLSSVQQGGAVSQLYRIFRNCPHLQHLHLIESINPIAPDNPIPEIYLNELSVLIVNNIHSMTVKELLRYLHAPKAKAISIRVPSFLFFLPDCESAVFSNKIYKGLEIHNCGTRTQFIRLSNLGTSFTLMHHLTGDEILEPLTQVATILGCSCISWEHLEALNLTADKHLGASLPNEIRCFEQCSNLHTLILYVTDCGVFFSETLQPHQLPKLEYLSWTGITGVETILDWAERRQGINLLVPQIDLSAEDFDTRGMAWAPHHNGPTANVQELEEDTSPIHFDEGLQQRASQVMTKFRWRFYAWKRTGWKERYMRGLFEIGEAWGEQEIEWPFDNTEFDHIEWSLPNDGDIWS